MYVCVCVVFFGYACNEDRSPTGTNVFCLSNQNTESMSFCWPFGTKQIDELNTTIGANANEETGT